MLTVFSVFLMDAGMVAAGCCTGCGAAGGAVDALLRIPAGLAGPVVCQDRGVCGECCASAGCACEAGDNSCGCRACGPVGGAVDWLLAVPAAVLGSLSSSHCHCGCLERHTVRYPRGCAEYRCAGVVENVAPRRSLSSTVQPPAYVTYSTVDRPSPVRPVPPAVAFNGPLTFDN